MSVNYYAIRTDKIAAEGSLDGLRKTVTVETRMHIGKLNGVSAFKLHIYPSEGINSEDDMMKRLAEPGWKIESEDGVVYLVKG